jgi:rhamnose utilization protein RhaD (predicted bifunctional aldolase and dehydrogenase)
MDTIAGAVKRKPDTSGMVNRFANSELLGAILCAEAEKSREGIDPKLRWHTWFVRNPEIAGFVRDEKSFHPLSSAFTPDHIVYAGSEPLFVQEGVALQEVWKERLEKTGLVPKTVVFQGLGVFGLGNSEKAARTATELFVDALKVAVYSESFGGPLFMGEDQIRFINNWEVERYRSKVSG